VERELIGKEAGIRTSMIVAAGAALFSIIGLTLPFVVAPPGASIYVVTGNAGFMTVIANIVIGIGFLGAGIIIKTNERVHGLTTAAVVWITAALGVLAGIGLYSFAFISTLIVAILLYLTRTLSIARHGNDESDDIQVQ
jgi:putative Mg2+ transporter-C (MgtC) family protein